MPAPPFARVQALPAPGSLGPASAVPLPTADELFRAYASYVAHIAIRILGRDDEVDDLVQDVFEAALKGIRRLPHGEPLMVRGWLATTTARMAARRLRRRRLLKRLGFGGQRWDDEGIMSAAMVGTPEQLALAARVYRLLDDVPVNHRVAWTMHKMEEETLPDVARALGCSLATAKRWIASTQAFVETRVADSEAAAPHDPSGLHGRTKGTQ